MGRKDKEEFERRASECDKRGHAWTPTYDDDGNITGRICTRCSLSEGK